MRLPSRFVLLVSAIGIFVPACGSDSRPTLGSFDKSLAMLSASTSVCIGGERYPKESYTCRFSLYDFHERSPLLNSERSLSECPCKGTMTLTRAPNGKDASSLQVIVQHCPHHIATENLASIIDYLIPKEHLERFRRDLDRASPNQQPEDNRVDAMRVYGDRTVEMSWTRDFFKAAKGEPQLQKTETYIVAIRARKSGDREAATSSREPVVVATPVCP